MVTRKQNALSPPHDAISNGIKLVSRIARTKTGPRRVGTISNEDGAILWHYGPHPTRESWSAGNPLRKPDLIFLEDERTEILRIRRISLFPSVFIMVEKNETIGSIRMKSVFRNKYQIQVGGDHLMFHQPPQGLCVREISRRSGCLGCHRPGMAMAHPAQAGPAPTTMGGDISFYSQ